MYAAVIESIYLNADNFTAGKKRDRKIKESKKNRNTAMN